MAIVVLFFVQANQGRVTVLGLFAHYYSTHLWLNNDTGGLTHFGPDLQLIFHWLYGQITPNTVTHPYLTIGGNTDRKTSKHGLITNLLHKNDEKVWTSFGCYIAWTLLGGRNQFFQKKPKSVVHLLHAGYNADKTEILHYLYWCVRGTEGDGGLSYFGEGALAISSAIFQDNHSWHAWPFLCLLAQ